MDFSRESAVRCILQRHIQLANDDIYQEKEELLREKLLVPEAWIHDAKVRSHSCAVQGSGDTHTLLLLLLVFLS